METPELPLPSLFFARMLIGFILCASCAGKHRSCEFLRPAAPACPEDTKTLFHAAPLWFIALNKLFASSSKMVPEPCECACAHMHVPVCGTYIYVKARE